MPVFNNYLDSIIKISDKYLHEIFSPEDYDFFLDKISLITDFKNKSDIVKHFSSEYISFIKEIHRKKYTCVNDKLAKFVDAQPDQIKIIWGDCYRVLQGLPSESIPLMVTSPPYYNAREYSSWKNLNDYLDDMTNIIKEAYRVLDNHRVFIFNVGDIFDNDNLTTNAVWGKRRLPLGAYFIKMFEEIGFSFIDDFIWDKGEVQSERHKHGDKPFPFYQYPMNCYEHLLIFHKHRLDNTRYPCPICGTLKVNGNTQSEPGLMSWECKNLECSKRSAGNRGKRFSLKTLTTQANKTKENQIPADFIYKWRRDIVKINPVFKINSKGENTLGHTAPFPDMIPEFAIRMFSYVNEKVLDPFAGSFTSAIIAKRLGRIGIGIELNKKMFRDSIIKNINKNFNEPLFSSEKKIIDEFDYENKN